MTPFSGPYNSCLASAISTLNDAVTITSVNQMQQAIGLVGSFYEGRVTRASSLIADAYTIERDLLIGTVSSETGGDLAGAYASAASLNVSRARALGGLASGTVYTLGAPTLFHDNVQPIDYGIGLWGGAADYAAKNDWGWIGAAATAAKMAFDLRQGTPLFGIGQLQSQLHDLNSTYDNARARIANNFEKAVASCRKDLE